MVNTGRKRRHEIDGQGGGDFQLGRGRGFLVHGPGVRIDQAELLDGHEVHPANIALPGPVRVSTCRPNQVRPTRGSGQRPAAFTAWSRAWYRASSAANCG